MFILRRKWDMVGWMVFYILAIPVFSFFLPLYSFWRMDDFSWGQTRVVLGESGKKMIVHVSSCHLRPITSSLNVCCRMRASSTRGLFLSSHGMITYVAPALMGVRLLTPVRTTGERALGQGVQPQHRILDASDKDAQRWLCRVPDGVDLRP